MIPSNKQAPVALVTGGARRIGAVICQHLQKMGFRVVIHYNRSQQDAIALANTLNQKNADSALALAADLNVKNAAEQLIERTIAWAQRLDLLVNNASVFKRSLFSVLNETEWELMFATNVKAPFWLSNAAFAHLAKQQGAIINITDTHADRPLKDYSIYCQTKAALAMQTQALAREFAPSVRVNAVAPGAIAWPEHDNALSPLIQQKIIAKTALKCHGNPLAIAQAVFALAENKFITGQTLRVDGGSSIT